jgi:hypothetical protein
MLENTASESTAAFACASHLVLNCPSDVADMLRFARDRMRTKYV